MTQFSYKSDQVQGLVSNPQNRGEEARKVIEAFGGTMHQFYYSLGEYDGVTIIEFPDQETATACIMAIVAAGAVSNIKTTPLLTMDEAVGAMQKASSVTSGYRPPVE
tara:strand:+ start:232 stop:552 length:321 start_codon:yes stop_codon:yes gene_type:complete